MQRRIRIYNSKSIYPDGKTNYVIDLGADTLNQVGDHSICNYIDTMIKYGRDILVFRR